MEKISSGSILNAFPKTAAKGDNKPKKYVIHMPADFNPVSDVEISTSEPRQPLMKSRKNDKDWIFDESTLTPAQHARVKKKLEAVGGIIEEDKELSIATPSRLPSDLDGNKYYLTDVPSCNATVDNVEFIVIDSKIYPNLPEFANANVTYSTQQYPGSGDACNSHGSEVASVIVGKNAGMIPNGKRSVYNIPVLGCNGSTLTSAVIKAFADAKSRAATNKSNNRRSVINLSIGSPVSSLLDDAVTNLVSEGVPVAVAAGNSAKNACTTTSPARADAAFTSGATYFGDKAATFTNWAPTNTCVDIYLPGVVYVVDVNNPKALIGEAGTSFSSPIGAGLLGIETEQFPTATVEQLVKMIKDRTEAVPVNGPVFYADMQLMPTTAACASKQLFTKYSSNTIKDWFVAPNINNFCVAFNINLLPTQQSAIIAIRQNSTDTNPILMNFTSKQAGKQFSLRLVSITQNGQTITATSSPLTFKTSAPRIRLQCLDNKLSGAVMINNKFMPLFSSTLENYSPQAISFASTSVKRMTFTNGVRC